jgi:hypothetical protein
MSKAYTKIRETLIDAGMEIGLGRKKHKPQ